jgi:adenosylcobyric acid synthase
MTARVLMVQGTASHVGKSILVAALCRIFRQDGYKVAPFKAQNMASSYILADGNEIGGIQAVQAEAAGVQPSVYMNPILLKPVGDSRSEVVLLGKPHATMSAVDYYAAKDELWPLVANALERLTSEYDIVVIEGAGGCAEINLADSEIVNMRVARYARAPVLLVSDIERGGVFASLIGTMELLKPEERSLVKAFIINKFRGDIDILKPGLRMLEQRTGIPVAGVIPWFNHIYFPEEDSLGQEHPHPGGITEMAEHDKLAELVHSSIDMDFIYQITGLKEAVQK